MSQRSTPGSPSRSGGSPTVVRIAPSVMERYVETLGAIGQQSGGGIIRPVYGPAWVEARQQIADWIAEAGLEPRFDAVGNVFGRLAGRADTGGVILAGSHFDTVRLGGKFDGALGVLAALAALRALREQHGPPLRTLEVVGLVEEEGSRFHANFWGTRGIFGLIEPEEMESLRDDDGITIGDAMRAVGIDPSRVDEARRDDLDAFFELHIEQGRILHDEGVQLGIVETITGIVQQVVAVTGRTDHAGTTPMDLRVDAFQGAAEMALEVTRLVAAQGRPAVVTTGKWDVQPGAANIVPGSVHFTIDLRHPDPAARRRLQREIEATCQRIADRRSLGLEMRVVQDMLERDLAPDLRRRLRDAAGVCGASHKPMVSGAGHDSQLVARHIPAAMLFVPSVDGRSHSPAEYTSPEDAARGASVLATALHGLAYA